MCKFLFNYFKSELFFFLIYEFLLKLGNAILYALLAGVCLSAHLLRGVGSLPVPTTTTTSTESPPISPAVSSDADTDESTAEASREVAYYTAVASTSRQESGEGSRTYTVTAIFKKPAPSPESDDSTDEQPTDPNLPLSSAVVSSSTVEESCSSGVVQRGPCRKRSVSTERISKEVLDFYTPGTKRSLREANPSSQTWAVPNIEKPPGNNDTSSSDSANSQLRQSRHSRDSDSPSPERSNKEDSSAFKSSSDSSSTDKSQPGTPM